MALVREVTYKDIDSVADLYRSVGWATPTIESWQRVWRDNPALAGNALARGWVLEVQSRIVGFMCNLTQEYRLGEQTLRAAIASSLVVEPKFRGETMKLVMAYARQSDVDVFLNTTAAPQTSKIFEFLKFRRIPQADYDLNLYWVLQPANFLVVAFRKKGWSPSLSRIAGPVVAPVLCAEMALCRRGPRGDRKSHNVAVVGADDIGQDFDDLWDRKLAEKPRLIANRTAATLRWHYATRSGAPPARLICAYSGSRLIGYATLVRRDSPLIGLKRAYIADIFVENDQPETIRRLLAVSACQARTDGASMLEAVGFPDHIRSIMREYRPYLLRNDSWPFLYCGKDPEVQRLLVNPAVWHACLFDGDGSI